MSNPLWEMTKGRWREFCREPSALFFVVLMPVIWMLILGYAFSGKEQERFLIGIASSTSETSNPYTEKLSNDSRFQISEGNLEELTLEVKRGNLQVAIAYDSKGQPSFYLDPSWPMAISTKRAIQEAIEPTHTNAYKEVDLSRVGGRYIDFLVPGLLALSILTTSLFGTGMTIVMNRRERLLKRYLATPMNSVHYIMSHLFGRLFILVVEILVVLITAKVFFDFSLQGDMISFVVFSMLGTLSFTAIAMLAGCRTANSAFYNGMINLLTLPMMLLSGIWFSRNNFPDWMEAITQYLPLSMLVDGLRAIALEGASITNLSVECAFLAGYLVIAAWISKTMFKWY